MRLNQDGGPDYSDEWPWLIPQGAAGAHYGGLEFGGCSLGCNCKSRTEGTSAAEPDVTYVPTLDSEGRARVDMLGLPLSEAVVIPDDLSALGA